MTLRIHRNLHGMTLKSFVGVSEEKSSLFSFTFVANVRPCQLDLGPPWSNAPRRPESIRLNRRPPLSPFESATCITVAVFANFANFMSEERWKAPAALYRENIVEGKHYRHDGLKGHLSGTTPLFRHRTCYFLACHPSTPAALFYSVWKMSLPSFYNYRSKSADKKKRIIEPYCVKGGAAKVTSCFYSRRRRMLEMQWNPSTYD